MTTRYLKTEAGIFKVTVNDDIVTNTNTRISKIIGKLINVGCKNTCVFINVLNNETTASLTNVKTRDGGCEYNNKNISGINTAIMIQLAFTILKENAPNIKYIKLEDTSSFKCELEKGKSYGISLAIYELAFHQKTWYEKYFGARLITNTAQTIYDNSKQGFYKKKPEHFSFNNKDLNELLTPLYNATTSWKDFFDKIYKMDKKCKIIFPWYKNAVSIAMDGILYDGQYWVIDVLWTKAPLKDIQYTETNLGIRGGSRKLISEYMEHDGFQYNSETFDHMEYEDIYNIPYTKSDLKYSPMGP